ncbi:MAG: hypothetical protein IT434_03400 [Phycisphaerales bacterium]|nr:hypothetical protein [Phycisphaerales bacterium]
MLSFLAQSFWSEWPWQALVGVALIVPAYFLARLLGGPKLIERLVYSTSGKPSRLTDALVEYAVLVQVAGGRAASVSLPQAIKHDPAFRLGTRMLADGADADRLRDSMDQYMNRFAARASHRRRVAVLAALAPIALLIFFMLAAAHIMATPSSTNAWSAAATFVALLAGLAGVTLGIPLLERLPRAETARLMELMLIEAALALIAQGQPPAAIRDRLRELVPTPGASPARARAAA